MFNSRRFSAGRLSAALLSVNGLALMPIAFAATLAAIPIPALAAVTAVASSAPKEFPKPDIDGVVVTPDGRPAVGAKVTWLTGKDDKEPPLSVMTDDQGQFHFDGKTAWSRKGFFGSVSVEAAGFAFSGGGVMFGRTPDASHAVSINVTLALPTEAHLRFLDPNGKPASGIKVRIRTFFKERSFIAAPPDFAGMSAVSAPDGTVTFKNLPAGWGVDYGIDNPEFAQLQDPDSQQKLTEASKTQWSDIRLTPAASIEGTLTTPDGKPVSKIGIQARTSDEPMRYGYGTSDENGHFLLSQMMPGQYTLTMSLPEPLNTQWATQDVLVTLAVSAHKTGLKLSLVKGAIITGHVAYRSGGQTASGIGISVASQNGNFMNGVAYGVTDASGNYRICAAGGDLNVNVQVQGMRAPSQDVTVKDGETRTVNFTIDPPLPPAVIQGMVVDSGGKPVANAEVTGAMMNFPQPPATLSGPDGKFTLTLSDAAMAYLRARKGGSITVKDMPAVGGDNVTLKLQDNALATITGKVVDSDGKPIADASVVPMVWRLRSGDNLDLVKTDANGVYQIDKVPPGYRYSLEVQAKGFASIYVEQVLPQAGQTLNEDNITLKRTDSFVGGRVIDSHGFPMAGADVTPDSYHEKRVTTDKQGKFHIDGVAPGDIVLEVSKGDEWTNMQVTAGKEDNLIKTYSRSAQKKEMAAQPKPTDYVGKYAPEFNVTNWVNVSPVSMSDLKGKIVIFDMWGCCVDSLYEAQQTAQQLAARGVIAIGLNVSGSSLKEVQEHIAKEKLILPIAIDKDTAKGLGGGGYECYSLVGRDGKIAYAGWDENEMLTTLGRLLAEEKNLNPHAP